MTQKLPYEIVFFDLGETLVSSAKDSNPSARKVWIKGALETINYLSQNAVLLGLISNTGEMKREALKKMLPADFRFDKFHPDLIILSSEVESEHIPPKPSLEIFSFALNRAKIIRQGIPLYCSENLEETLAAQRAGMQALRLLTPSAEIVEEDLVNLGALLKSTTKI